MVFSRDQGVGVVGLGVETCIIQFQEGRGPQDWVYVNVHEQGVEFPIYLARQNGKICVIYGVGVLVSGVH